MKPPEGERLFDALRAIEPPRDAATGRARLVSHAHDLRRKKPPSATRAMIAIAATFAVAVTITWWVARAPAPAPTAARADTDTCETCAAPRLPAAPPTDVPRAPASAMPTAQPARKPEVIARPASPAPSSEPQAPAAKPSWSAFEERGDYDGAYAAAADEGLASLHRAASADELLRLAQVSRVSGHRGSEREALLACRLRFPGTEASAIAAYELGRAASGADAVTWFETYLREQPSGPLAREASGRLLEAHAAGRGAEAKDAARRYLARWPDGPHAPLAKRVLE